MKAGNYEISVKYVDGFYKWTIWDHTVALRIGYAHAEECAKCDAFHFIA